MSTVERISRELNGMLAEPLPVTHVTPLPVAIPEIGIHADIPMAHYIALPLMSAGRLEKLRRSPLQYRHSLVEPPKPTPPMETGTALHLAVLEPHLFEAHYVVIGQCEGLKKDRDRCGYNGSVYRNGHSWCRTHDPLKGAPSTDDVEVIGAEDYTAVLGMRDAIIAHPRARTLFEGRGAFETTIIFRDDETGVLCKARPDRLIERAAMLVDVKTCRDGAPWAFPRAAENLGYFRKLAFYRRALRAIGWNYGSTAVVAVESAAPYDLACYLVDEASLDSADREVSRLLRQYVTCEETGIWSGYADDFTILQRPSWAQNGDTRE
jgi:PDDEXK-like uncharacterized protein DUF3799